MAEPPSTQHPDVDATPYIIPHQTIAFDNTSESKSGEAFKHIQLIFEVSATPPASPENSPRTPFKAYFVPDPPNNLLVKGWYLLKFCKRGVHTAAAEISAKTGAGLLLPQADFEKWISGFKNSNLLHGLRRLNTPAARLGTAEVLAFLTFLSKEHHLELFSDLVPNLGEMTLDNIRQALQEVSEKSKKQEHQAVMIPIIIPGAPDHAVSVLVLRNQVYYFDPLGLPSCTHSIRKEYTIRSILKLCNEVFCDGTTTPLESTASLQDEFYNCGAYTCCFYYYMLTQNFNADAFVQQLIDKKIDITKFRVLMLSLLCENYEELATFETKTHVTEREDDTWTLLDEEAGAASATSSVGTNSDSILSLAKLSIGLDGSASASGSQTSPGGATPTSPGSDFLAV